jgi:hypothetical protein
MKKNKEKLPIFKFVPASATAKYHFFSLSKAEGYFLEYIHILFG